MQKKPRFDFRPDEVSSNFAQWCSWKGEKPRVAGPNPSPYMVSKRIAHATPQDVIFRDPGSFVAGELSCHQSYWNFILSEHPQKDEIFSYIVRGVNISDFFVPFKGDFQGKFCNSASPRRRFFPTANRVLISRSSLVPLSLPELKTAHSWFREKLALFSHPIWFCPSRWSPLSRECATMSVF